MSTNYFQAYEEYFWRLEDDTQASDVFSNVFAIPNGNSIVYVESLADIFKGIKDQGLPRLGTMLMALIALNSSATDDLAKVKWILASQGDIDVQGNISDAFLFLTLLSTVPQEYKSGELKIALLRAIFENCHYKVSIKTSEQAICNIGGDKMYSSQIKLTGSSLSKDFKPLDILSKKYTSVDAILAKVSGVPIVEEDITLEETKQEEDSKDFIEELTENQNTFKVGALVKTLWAGLNLPMHSGLKSEQAMGGVSDLTNKGNYDQLLISEYANEELVFLSRLANNEVLYLSKETPPVSNDLKRIILIDVSLKNWGTPKVISFAIMTAIAQMPNSEIECSVYLVGDKVLEVECGSVLGMIKALQVVEPSLNFVSGIEQYFEELPANNKKGVEHFVITEQSTLFDTEVLHVLSEYKNQIDYLITNSESGNVEIYKNSKNGRKHLKHLEINIPRLWKSKTIESKLQIPVDENLQKGKETFYPLLVPQNSKSVGLRRSNNGAIYQLTKERSLLKHKDEKAADSIGWEIVYEGLPASIKDYDIVTLSNGDTVLLTFNVQHKKIRLLNLITKEEKIVTFNGWWFHKEEVFAFENDTFYYGNDFSTWKISKDGELFPPPHSKAYLLQEKRKSNEELLHKFRPVNSVLKNIKKIGFSSNSELLFNYHRLSISGGSHIQIHTQQGGDVYDISAIKTSRDTFEFKDGSEVEVNRNGFVILKSSDKEIPFIYISTVLEGSIGVATQEEFAGNRFYKNAPSYDIRLLDAGTARLALTKVVIKVTRLGLKESRSIVESVPCHLRQSLNLEQAKQVLSTLEGAGAEAQIIPLSGDFGGLTTIDKKVFFEKYINRFIQTIKSYGVKG